MIPDMCYIVEVMGIEVARIIHLLKEGQLNCVTVIDVFSVKIG